MLRRVLPVAIWFAGFATDAIDAGPPNFVILVADDLGWADVGYHGSRINTPHIDRLAAEGLKLNQFYVSPVCSTTRAALLSGRYWSRFGLVSTTNGQVFPFGTETLASALASVGYETALVGKWHLGSRPELGPRQFGFTHSYGLLAGGCGPYTHQYKGGVQTWHRNDRLIDEEGHVTDLLADEAVRWIESRGDKPFLLYAAFTAPHVPLDEPQQWLDTYPEIDDVEQLQYAASVTHLDNSIGRIVSAVKHMSHQDNTLIVFFSDNGATRAATEQGYPGTYPAKRTGGSNEPLRGRKAQVYEGGIRVPAFVHWPGRLTPGICSDPIHVVDWMPTFCALAQSQPEPDLKWDGRNVWPWLTGETTPEPRPLYWAGVGFRTAAVQYNGWKLVMTRESGKTELFHLPTDPYEQHDLAERDPERVTTLRELMVSLSARDNESAVRSE